MAKEGRESNSEKPRRRWWRVPALLIILLIALVWFAPWIVASTALRDRLVPTFVPEFEGRCHIGRAHFSWLSPVELHDVEIKDKAGQPLARAAHVACNHSLGALIFQRQELKIQLHQPLVHCVLRDDGSNLEDALRPFLHSDEPSATPTPAFTIEVTGATVELVHAAGGPGGKLSNLNMTCEHRPNIDRPLTVRVATNVSGSGQDAKPGSLETKLHLSRDPASGTFTVDIGQATLITDQIAADAFAPLLRRFLPEVTATGQLTTDLAFDWDRTATQPRIAVAGQFDGTNWSIAAPDWLGNEPLTVPGLQSVLKMTLVGDRLQIEKCKLDSRLAVLDMHGTLFVPDTTNFDLAALMGDEDYSLGGRVDLAQLAARFPALLRLRDDTNITAGELDISLNSAIETGVRRWQGSIVTSSLQGTAGGRPVEWQRPIELLLDAKQTAEGDVSGRLTCRSEFLNVAAEGSLAEATLTAKGDLDRLAAELRQFVDLGSMKLAGKLDAGLRITRGSDQNFDADGHALLQQFQFQMPGRSAISEPRLSLAVAARGAADTNGVARLDAATVRLISGGDRLDVRLLQPVNQPDADATWPLQIDMDGALVTWMQRAEPFVSLKDWHLDGNVQAHATTIVSPRGVEFQPATIKLEKLTGTVAEMKVAEPRVEIETSGSWNRIAGRLESKLTTLASSSLSLRAGDVVFVAPHNPAGTPPQLSGDVAFRGSLSRLQALLGVATADYRLAGQLEGQLRFTDAAQRISGQGSATIGEFGVFVPKVRTGVAPAAQSNDWEPVWQERQLSLGGSAAYDKQRDNLTFKEIALKSSVLQLEKTGGTLSRALEQPSIDVSGEVHYDLATVTRLLRPHVGDEVVLSGRGARGFAFRGPLSSADGTDWLAACEGEAGVGWSEIRAYGLVGSDGEVRGQLKSGVIQMAPLDLTIGEGRLQTTPQVHLAADPAQVVLSAGTKLEQMRITPELCQSWLQYVAPLLANATRAEGRFSMDVQRGTLPLAQPGKGKVLGTLTIHEAAIRPGPLTEQLIAVAEQVSAIIRRQPGTAAGNQQLTIQPQEISFQLSDGRVHHRYFQLQVGDVVIRTHGSVGVDQTLALTADVPIRDQWVERDKYLQSLRGQTLQIAISGTLSRPRLDRRALQQLARKMAGSAAGSLINDALNKEVGKGLDRLFRNLPK